MSDDLTLSGGGVVAVATDGQLQLATCLVELGASCSTWADRVDTVTADEYSRLPLGPSVLPQADARAGSEAAARGAASLRQAGEQAARLGGSLLSSAEAYGNAERVVASLFETAGGVLAWVVGSSPLLTLSGAVWIGGLLLTRAAVRGLVGVVSPEAGEHLDDISADTMRQLMATPGFVAAVRAVVSASDDWLVGAGGLPAFAQSVDAAGRGVTGAAFSAAIVAGAADAAGLFSRTGITVTEVSERQDGDREAVRPPTSYQDLAERMPSGGAGSPQVRIERYVEASGHEQWIVWSGGTIEAGFPADSTEPWDNRSNLNAVAGTAAESTEATLEAMRLAGIPEGASVLHVGYSQGGIVAGAIAATGRYDSSLVTFGAPVETIDFPDDVPRAHIEHTEDVIPALSGERRESFDGGTVVRRSLYDGDGPPPGEDALPAHSLDRYEETARLVDGSDDPRLRAVIEPLGELGGTGESHRYRADRVP